MPNPLSVRQLVDEPVAEVSKAAGAIVIAAKLSVSKPVNFDTERKPIRSVFLLLLSLASFASFTNAAEVRTYNAWLAEFNAEVATNPTDAEMRQWTFYHMPFVDAAPTNPTNPTNPPDPPGTPGGTAAFPGRQAFRNGAAACTLSSVT